MISCVWCLHSLNPWMMAYQMLHVFGKAMIALGPLGQVFATGSAILKLLCPAANLNSHMHCVSYHCVTLHVCKVLKRSAALEKHACAPECPAPAAAAARLRRQRLGMGMPWEQMQVSHCPQRTCALAAAAREAATWCSASMWDACSGAGPALACAVSSSLNPTASCMTHIQLDCATQYLHSLYTMYISAISCPKQNAAHIAIHFAFLCKICICM